MSKIKNEMATRCELALMGKAVPINNNGEVNVMTMYMLDAIGVNYDPDKFDVLNKGILHYTKTHEVKYIVSYRLYGMPCIAYLLDSGMPEEDEAYYPAPFQEDYGTGCPCAFCYVFNTSDDWCSEFGDVFFEKKSDGYFHIVAN